MEVKDNPSSPTILVDRAELKEILNQNESMKKDIKVLKTGVTSVMDLMGLIDKKTGLIKPEIESGEESFIPGMLKSLGDVVTLLTRASAGRWFGGDKAKEELGNKFSFIQDLLPIIKKYQSNG
jgi:hypothetical protein